MIKKLFSTAVLLSIALLSFEHADAQFTSTLGASSLTGQRFDCVTYAGGEDIVIYNSKGKSVKVSKKKAASNIKGSQMRAARRIAALKKAIKAKRARMKELLNSPLIALPKYGQEFEQLKIDLPKVEALLEQAKAQKSELKFLLSAVNSCGKTPPPIAGSNILVQYSITLPKSGDQAYGIHAVHAFAVPPGVPDRICVSYEDGPYYQIGIRYSVGTTFYDGPGTANQVSHSEPAPLGVGYLPIFGKAGLFRLGNYDTDLAEVQGYLSKSYRMFIPTAEKTCPRP